MKKLVLITAAAAAIAAVATVTPASAGFKGCCGGWNGGGWGGGWGGGFHHWHGGYGGIGIGFVDAGYGGGDCYYVRRTVIVPGIGPVNKRQLVCE